MTQLHEILTDFEMKGGPLDMREAAFKASTRGKEEHNESRHISEEDYEVNFVKIFHDVLEGLEVSYPSNVFLVVESVIMLPDVLIKKILKKERNMQNGIENKLWIKEATILMKIVMVYLIDEAKQDYRLLIAYEDDNF